MAEHALTADPTHSIWDRDLAPRLTISSGDTVQFSCHDASGGQVFPGMTAEQFLGIDRSRIHALTGPVAIHGAQPGDVLQVDVLQVAHRGWAWTSVIEGLGFLDERFREPALFHWQLDGDRTTSLAPATVPLKPFCGVMGVAPPQSGQHRTRPPGAFGGNMDVRELSTGATLYLPVFAPGALFSCGDAHAAQGDGEVCINGMECPADATLRFTLHRGRTLAGPIVESVQRSGEDGPSWMVVESAENPLAAARAATGRMVDLLVETWDMSPLHAYLLCSVSMDLRLSQVVNRPMTTVSASIRKSVLPPARLFLS